MKLRPIALLLCFSLLCSISLGAPLFNLAKLLQNHRLLRKALDSQLDEENSTNYTKEEYYDIFKKVNLSRPIEPPPSSGSGSGSGDDNESGDSECSEDEFTCKDGGCIPIEKECDGRFNCKDKSDEDKSYCKGRCKHDEFKCDNGNCIKYYHRCDGDNDCLDGSDEEQKRCLEIECPRSSNVHCPSGLCIEIMFLCDGIMDCPDNWDERVCPN